MKSIQWPTAAVCIAFVLVVGALLFFGKSVPAGWVGIAGTVVSGFMQAILGGSSGGTGGAVTTLPKSAPGNGTVPPAAARVRFVRLLGTAVPAFFVVSCANGQLPPNTVTGITAGVNFAVCVLGQYAQCTAAKTPWPTCTVQIIQACGGDAVSIAAVVDAHRASEVQEGFVVPDGGK